jgi:Tol biopolymer transport system component
MTKFLVEVKGDGINNELYYVAVNDQPEQLLPDFNRVGVPDWSLDGQTIAFAASENGSESSTNLFSGGPGLQQAMDYPWNIYLMDDNTGDSRILLENVQHVHIIKLSPQSDRLAFWGTVDEKEGIWILNLDTSELRLVWDEHTSFDWSLDGQQMILRAHEDRDGTTWGYPVIIDIPTD